MAPALSPEATSVRIAQARQAPKKVSPFIVQDGREPMKKFHHRASSSLLFEMELSSELNESGGDWRLRQDSGNFDEVDAFKNIAMQQALEMGEPQSPFEQELARSVQKLRASCTSDAGVLDLHALRRGLKAAGYVVEVIAQEQRHKLKNTADCWHHLRHSFLLCVGLAGPGNMTLCYQKVPCLVDPNFKSQFSIANPSPWYEDLHEVLPNEFVGPMHRLKSLVSFMCDEMGKAFKEQRLSVPPWRSKHAMLSKWTGPLTERASCEPTTQPSNSVSDPHTIPRDDLQHSSRTVLLQQS